MLFRPPEGKPFLSDAVLYLASKLPDHAALLPVKAVPGFES